MRKAEHLYGDDWGDVLYRPAADLVEIRWFDTTVNLTGEGFNDFLHTFAGFVERERPRAVLIDAVQFRMDFARMDTRWRDANIVPRYNAAGVRKLALIVPGGMPLIGARPAPEGGANFPTGYFGTRSEALRWLAERATKT